MPSPGVEAGAVREANRPYLGDLRQCPDIFVANAYPLGVFNATLESTDGHKARPCVRRLVRRGACSSASVAVLADVNAGHAVFVALYCLRDYMVSRSAALEAVMPFDTRDGDFLFLDVHKLQHVGVQQISVRGVIDACPMIHG